MKHWADDSQIDTYKNSPNTNNMGLWSNSEKTIINNNNDKGNNTDDITTLITIQTILLAVIAFIIIIKTIIKICKNYRNQLEKEYFNRIAKNEVV